MAPGSSIAFEIHQRLQQTRRHLYKTDATAKAFLFGSVVLSSISFLVLLEILFHFNAFARSLLVVLSTIAFVVCCAWLVLRPLFRVAGMLQSDDDFAIAKLIGDYFPTIRDSLTNFLQLQHEAAKATALYSKELLEASFTDFGELVKPLSFDSAVDESSIAKMRKWFAGSAGIVLVLFLMFPASMPSALFRLVHCNTEFVVPPKYVFDVFPGNKEVVKGEQVPIRVRISSADELVFRPAAINLFYRLEGQELFDQT